MKKNSVITILFPTLFMLMLIILFSLPNGMYIKDLLVISLIFIFPLLFLLQGIKSSINNTNIIISMSISILNFVAFILIYLNSSAIIYVFIYLVLGMVGYILTNFITKKKSKK